MTIAVDLGRKATKQIFNGAISTCAEVFRIIPEFRILRLTFSYNFHQTSIE